MTIGDHVLINDYVVVNSGLAITIEDWVTIAPHCQIVDGDHGTTDPERPIRQQDEDYVVAPVHIGRDVWLGCHVVVLKGVTIGAGATIGAGSVVTRDIPERAIAVGVPARVVGWRGGTPPAAGEDSRGAADTAQNEGTAEA
ncbi:MAG: acyltransferase [Chloroflexi bacterium]|nr:acyltransferase [Chloroflexota bacterium]